MGKSKNKKLNPYIKNQSKKGILNTNFGFTGGDFVVGALIGATVTFLLTNETASKAVLKGLAKGTNFLQSGFEELKERFEDAKAEAESGN
ncbi:MAG: YtxH domain-containing protein [Campylobacteraceae bacterium]|jgi:hypothetical protein|nr:YtxH domain-containing protein [Campylobacteraceae bacterium]